MFALNFVRLILTSGALGSSQCYAQSARVHLYFIHTILIPRHPKSRADCQSIRFHRRIYRLKKSNKYILHTQIIFWQMVHHLTSIGYVSKTIWSANVPVLLHCQRFGGKKLRKLEEQRQSQLADKWNSYRLRAVFIDMGLISSTLP